MSLKSRTEEFRLVVAKAIAAGRIEVVAHVPEPKRKAKRKNRSGKVEMRPAQLKRRKPAIFPDMPCKTCGTMVANRKHRQVTCSEACRLEAARRKRRVRYTKFAAKICADRSGKLKAQRAAACRAWRLRQKQGAQPTRPYRTKNNPTGKKLTPAQRLEKQKACKQAMIARMGIDAYREKRREENKRHKAKHEAKKNAHKLTGNLE